MPRLDTLRSKLHRFSRVDDRVHRTARPTVLCILAVALLPIAFAACSRGPTEIELGEETTHDGLRIVKNTVAYRVWIRPGLDLSGYNKLLLQDAGIEYRPPGPSKPGAPRAYPMSDKAKRRLSQTMDKVFRDELGRSKRFSLTRESGPDVLIVRGGLIDVVSYVPPERIGPDDIYLSRIGEITLVTEVRDSVSQAALARMADRRPVQREGGDSLQRSNAPMNQEEVRRLARRWAVAIREGLEELHDHTPAAD